MHRNVELLIGRLVTDPDLLRRFSERPREELLGQGLDLTNTEIEALARLSPESLRALSDRLDPRIRKAPPAGHSDPRDRHTTPGDTPTTPETHR